jgi:hypothetical protein
MLSIRRSVKKQQSRREKRSFYRENIRIHYFSW